MDIKLDQRRHLRRHATDGETALWACLRGRRFAGFKFRRQHPCGPFILDFYCERARVAVELDGGQHLEAAAQAYDARRDEYLAARGIRVLRFGADVVLTDRESILTALALALGVDGAGM